MKKIDALGPGTLVKSVPGEIITTEYKWILRAFMEMSDNFRAARANRHWKMDRCVHCATKFVNGDVVGLICLDTHNDVICQSCIDNIEKGSQCPAVVVPSREEAIVEIRRLMYGLKRIARNRSGSIEQDHEPVTLSQFAEDWLTDAPEWVKLIDN